MKAHFFLFNIEGYGELFSGITPRCSDVDLTHVNKCERMISVLHTSVCRSRGRMVHYRR